MNKNVQNAKLALNHLSFKHFIIFVPFQKARQINLNSLSSNSDSLKKKVALWKAFVCLWWCIIHLDFIHCCNKTQALWAPAVIPQLCMWLISIYPLVTPPSQNTELHSHACRATTLSHLCARLHASLRDFAEPFPAASNANYVHRVTSSTHDCLFWPVTESDFKKPRGKLESFHVCRTYWSGMKSLVTC